MAVVNLVIVIAIILFAMTAKSVGIAIGVLGFGAFTLWTINKM